MDRLNRMTPEERKAALLEMSTSPAAAQKSVWGSVENAGRTARETAAVASVSVKAAERAKAEVA